MATLLNTYILHSQGFNLKDKHIYLLCGEGLKFFIGYFWKHALMFTANRRAVSSIDNCLVVLHLRWLQRE